VQVRSADAREDERHAQERNQEVGSTALPHPAQYVWVADHGRGAHVTLPA
jgi:hypothetical protein